MSEQESFDIAMAKVARDLADALIAFARDRHHEQKAVVAELQTQLCATRRVELAAQAQVVEPVE